MDGAETSGHGAEPRAEAQIARGASASGAGRVVVLTTRSWRGAIMIQALVDAGITPDAVVVDRGEITFRQLVRKSGRSLRRRGIRQTWRKIQQRAIRTLKRLVKRRTPRYFPGAVADRVFEVGDPNSEEGQRLLRDLAPDVVVVGYTRILTQDVLTIPALGVLNAHPGVLPDYRGVDVIHWAVHTGDPIGVTVHFVDAGIDTGDIVACRTFRPKPGDTMETLYWRAACIAGELMADVVRRLLTSGQIDRIPQPSDRGHAYGRMPPKLRRQVEAQLMAQTHRGTC